MSVTTMKNISEQAVRLLAAALIGLCCWIGKDTLLQLRRIQTDLESIKVKLAVMEANAMTPATVKQLIQVELSKHASGHKE